MLFAPGHQILTLTPGGHYDFASGSSLSCAHVTGAVALLLARQPKLDADTVYALLKRSSLPAVVGDAGTIDVEGALAAVVGTPSVPAAPSTQRTAP